MCGNNQEVLKSLFLLLTKKLFPLRPIAEIIQNLESRCCGERYWEGKAGDWKGNAGLLTNSTLSELHTPSSWGKVDCGVHSELGAEGPHLKTVDSGARLLELESHPSCACSLGQVASIYWASTSPFLIHKRHMNMPCRIIVMIKIVTIYQSLSP